MSAHSVLAPSSSVRWKNCIAAPAATAHLTGDTSNEFAREGSAAHHLGENALGYERQCEFWLNEKIDIAYEEDGVEKTQTFIVDQEMADYVQVYVDAVRRQPGELMIEQEFDLSEVYGVPDQKGTGDAVVLDYENMDIYVGDLKFGRGIKVFAKDNDQLYSYGAGALREHSLVGDWKTVTVAIHQPRLNHYDEYTIPVEELEAWIAETATQAKAAIALIGQDADVIERAKTAGESQCQWCPIKGSCQTLAKFVHESVFEDFVTLDGDPSSPRVELSDDDLGKLMLRADLIESTVKAWRSEGFKRVQSGEHVPGWKLVAGKRGARKWESEEAAKKVMKGARMKDDEIYSKKLLTAPAAEKVIAKAKPKVWKKLTALIVQAEGSPSLAVESDPRPELKVADSESFKDESDVSDLL